MKPVKTFEVTVQYTRRIVAYNEEDIRQAISITQESLMDCGYKILDIQEVDIFEEEKNPIMRMGTGSINDQYEFNKSRL